MSMSPPSEDSESIANTLLASAGVDNAAAHAQQGGMGRYRWLICSLLFLATSVNYIDRQILSLLKPILDQQIGWTNAQFGLVNSAFQGAYACGLLFFGWFVDRFGTKLGYAVSIVLWSLSAASHAFAVNLTGFFAARMALGIGEGGNFPSAIKAVALWFPKRERAFATSLFNAGANVGAIMAPAIVPWVALRFGWQAAFVLAGILGSFWLLLWLPFYNTPDKIKRLSAAELALIRSDGDDTVGGDPKTPWLKLLGYRQTWSFIAAKFLTDPIWWFFLIWLPDYFAQTRGLNLTKSWVHLVAIYSIVTVFSIMGGWVTGYMTKRGLSVSLARKSGMLLFALMVIPIYAVTAVGDWTAVILIGFAGAAHQAWSANLYTTVSDMFPKRAVASVVGIGSMAGALGGMLFPIITGRLLDSCKASGDVTQGYTILFSVCAFGYVAAFIINHLLAPRFTALQLGDV